MSSPITLVAVGDLQLGDSPTTVGYGFYSRYAGARLDEMLADTRSAFAGADIVFGNLETTLVPPRRGVASRRELQLRGELRYAADLKNAGFTVLNVANNHAVQHGDDTFHSTVTAVSAAGIACCGVRGTDGWTTRPAMLDVRGTRVGVLGYSQRPRQYGAAVPPYAEGTAEGIQADVARLRATGATVIVSLHWGEEFVPHPSADEVAFGRAIVDAGASLVIGHHPHVTRPAERYKFGLIAYSLGNFMGDMTWYSPFRTGAILRCTIDGDAVTDASILTTTLRDDYRPIIGSNGASQPLADGQLVGMQADAYARAISETMRQQRMASYRDAIVRLPRTPLPILMQLVAQTISNKLEALGSRISSRQGRY